jgi:hypothetical protein
VAKQTVLQGVIGTLALWGVGAVALRAIVVPAQICPAVTSASALAAVHASASWIERVQNQDGTYLYEYNRDTGQVSKDYNAVRHGGVTMSLYMLAASDPSVLPAADRGLGWMQANLLRHGDWAALRDPTDGRIELGASALMLAGLAQRRIATNDSSYDGLMHELMRFVLVMQQGDGSFLLAWLPSIGAPDPVERSPYATGEAFWALTLMHRAFPGEGWDVPSRKVADYISNYRDTVEHQKYPPWADQWAAYGLAEMADWPLNDDNVRYARSLAERFGFLMRVESQRRDSSFSDLIHGRQARAAGMGTWVEGLDSLWRLASVEPRMRDMRDKIGERAACGAGMLAERQQTARQAAASSRPAVIEGAWYTEGVTRMDDQQHALAGLLRSRAILDSRAGGGQ